MLQSVRCRVLDTATERKQKTAVTNQYSQNRYKCGLLKQHIFIPSSSRGRKSKINLNGLKSRYPPGLLPSGGSRGEFISCLFRPLETSCSPWFVTSSCRHSSLSRLFSHLFSQSSLRLPLTSRLWLHLGPNWIIQENLSLPKSLI